MSVGYTKTQAQTAKNRIDREMARIEDAAASLRRAVPDHSLTTDRQVEELREVAHQLKAIVDRRTR